MKITYDTRPCRRCGGSGEYSYNLRDGSRCFGCGGSGKTLTLEAMRAKELLAQARPTVPVTQVAPGDTVQVPHSLAGRPRWVVVAESGSDKLNPGRWHLSYSVGTDTSYGYGPYDTDVLPRAMTDVERENYYALAATLDGVTVSEQ